MGWHNVAYLKPLAARLLMQNLPPAELLRAHRLPATLLLEEGGAWIRRDTSLRMVSELGRRTDDPWAGLHTAELLRIEECGAWGREVLQSQSLREALHAARVHMGRLLTHTSLVLEQDGDQLLLGMRLEGTMTADPSVHHQANLMLMRMLVELAGERVPVVSHLAGSEPRDVQAAEQLLGPDLVFGARWNHLSIPRSALDLPLTSQRLTCRQSHMRAERVQGMAKAAFDSVRNIIQLHRPTIVVVAARLGVSVRTLQRHLQAWGMAFEEMVDEYRRHHALVELRAGNLPITEIGFRLGYSDSAHFSRAVRRWTGSCPRDLREAGVLAVAGLGPWLPYQSIPPAIEQPIGAG